MSIVPGCRCAELREVFGSRAAERCGPCAAAARAVELTEAGFVPVVGPMRELTDADIEQESVFADGGFVRWAPEWAAHLRNTLVEFNRDPVPALARARDDEVFRAACQSVMACDPSPAPLQFDNNGTLTIIGVDYAADWYRREVGSRLVAFIRAQGIEVEELPEDAEGD